VIQYFQYARTTKTEYKSIWKNEYLKWICGFANVQGGTLIIGKDDEGNIVDVKNVKNYWKTYPTR
jgi:ATP-dependent DNA helicase RecG